LAFLVFSYQQFVESRRFPSLWIARIIEKRIAARRRHSLTIPFVSAMASVIRPEKPSHTAPFGHGDWCTVLRVPGSLPSGLPDFWWGRQVRGGQDFRPSPRRFKSDRLHLYSSPTQPNRLHLLQRITPEYGFSATSRISFVAVGLSREVFRHLIKLLCQVYTRRETAGALHSDCRARKWLGNCFLKASAIASAIW
jgi:hypothetical protein